MEDPEKEIEKSFGDLLKMLNTRDIRKSIKGGYRKTAKRLKNLAVGKLSSKGVKVQGDKADWTKAIRTYIYSRGGGFLVSVKPHKKKGFHKNRRYGITKRELPILMWLEEGTEPRQTKGYSRKKHGTGAIGNNMQPLGIMAETESEGVPIVEENLYKDLEESVTKIAKKAGFI